MPGALGQTALATLSEADRAEAHRRRLVLRAHLEDRVPLTRMAAESGIPHRTLQRRLARYQAGGLAPVGPARLRPKRHQGPRRAGPAEPGRAGRGARNVHRHGLQQPGPQRDRPAAAGPLGGRRLPAPPARVPGTARPAAAHRRQTAQGPPGRHPVPGTALPRPGPGRLRRRISDHPLRPPRSRRDPRLPPWPVPHPGDLPGPGGHHRQPQGDHRRAQRAPPRAEQADRRAP